MRLISLKQSPVNFDEPGPVLLAAVTLQRGTAAKKTRARKVEWREKMTKQKNSMRLPGLAGLALLFIGIALLGDATYRQANEQGRGGRHLIERIAGGLLLLAGCASAAVACRMEDPPSPSGHHRQQRS